jgi:hypothetical protein
MASEQRLEKKSNPLIKQRKLTHPAGGFLRSLQHMSAADDHWSSRINPVTLTSPNSSIEPSQLVALTRITYSIEQ